MAIGDMFLKVETARSGPIKGEAHDDTHRDEIDVTAWSWGMRAHSDLAAAGATSKATLNELRVTKKIDSASTALMSTLRSNELIKKVTLTVRKAGGDALEYLTITLQQARLTELNLDTSGTEVVEHLSFAFQSVNVQYKQQGGQGLGKGTTVFEAQTQAVKWIPCRAENRSMAGSSAAESALKNGDPHGALKLLQEEIRGKSSDPKLRVFLFQLLSVLGQWERALNQLEVAANLDPATLAMAQTYREAVRCEVLRAQVFAGNKSPMVFGHPEQWLALLIESLLLAGRGQTEESDALRARAFDEAPATSGTLNSQPFEWIADADMRLGPVLEAVINGRYYWVPFNRLTRVAIEEPEDLRDVVWTPAHLLLENGGEAYALVPTRYPGTEKQEDGALLLARQTIWDEPRSGLFCGLGQRLLSTDAGEVSLMDVRDITLNPAPAADATQ